jgi:hypothetical protein
LIFGTRGKETQLYNTTTVCLGLGGRKKHTHTTNKLFLQDQTSVGGAAAPLASTPPSAESDPASDDDMVGGPPPRRKMSAPRLGHRRQGLLQEPSPSRWPDRPLRSLSQPSPGDTDPAHGLVSPTPGLVPESRLEGGMNRANLKFTNLITTTSRVSVRNRNESEKGHKTNRKRIKSVTQGFILPRFGSLKPTPR